MPSSQMAAMSQRRNQYAELSSTIAGAMGVKAVVVAPRAVFADRDPSHTTLASAERRRNVGEGSPHFFVLGGYLDTT